MRGLILVLALGVGATQVACAPEIDPDSRGQGVGYRRGIAADEYRSNGERGNLEVTEIFFAGSVTDDGVHDPDDIFIEFRNGHPRPVYLTDWQLIVQTGTGDQVRDAEYRRTERPRKTYAFPERENGQPVYTNEYVVMAVKRDGAFRDADFYLEDLTIPKGRFSITIRDIDDRLINGAGDHTEDVVAGGYDLVTSRSMERVQLLFSNNGARNSSWHAYSYNAWDAEHAERSSGVGEGYREHTFASPGKAATPDYSGNASAGNYE
jgi:hypothetical protein